MLKGDIGKLAQACGISKSTVYRIARKLNLILKPVHRRCDKTVDVFSGYTLEAEQREWMDAAIADIRAYRARQEKHVQDN